MNKKMIAAFVILAVLAVAWYMTAQEQRKMGDVARYTAPTHN